MSEEDKEPIVPLNEDRNDIEDYMDKESKKLAYQLGISFERATIQVAEDVGKQYNQTGEFILLWLAGRWENPKGKRFTLSSGDNKPNATKVKKTINPGIMDTVMKTMRGMTPGSVVTLTFNDPNDRIVCRNAVGRYSFKLPDWRLKNGRANYNTKFVGDNGIEITLY